jgi:HD-GYP domain-containing protein (c-di-GMP phosphodiesterase class II)
MAAKLLLRNRPEHRGFCRFSAGREVLLYALYSWTQEYAQMVKQRIELRGVGEWRHLAWTTDKRLCIGRMNTCEGVVDDPSVSRLHVEIVYANHGWVVRDLGSTNGTLLNGARLGRIDQRLQLHDRIEPGAIALEVTELVEDAGPLSAIVDEAVSFEVRGALQRTQKRLVKTVGPAEPTIESRLAQPSTGTSPIYGKAPLESLLHASLQDAVHALQAQRGVILLAEDNGHSLKLHAACSRAERGEPSYHNIRMAKRCFRERNSLLCEHAQAAGPGGSNGAVDVSSILCVLLGTPEKPLGVLHLDRGFAQAPFTLKDLHKADALAASLSVGIASVQVLLEKQRGLFMQTVLALAQAVDCRDRYTAGHTQRVTDYALLLAEKLHVSSEDYHHLQIGTPLHDIGKIGIDDAVLRKSGRLSREEFEHIKDHTVKGAAILEPIPQLASVLPIVRNHHERWNGGGYPDGLSGEQIPHLARLVTVADVFDALTSDRPYREALTSDQAFELLRQGAGSHFDPDYANAFLALRPQLEQMLRDRGSFTDTVSRQELVRMSELARRTPSALPVRPVRV